MISKIINQTKRFILRFSGTKLTLGIDFANKRPVCFAKPLNVFEVDTSFTANSHVDINHEWHEVEALLTHAALHHEINDSFEQLHQASLVLVVLWAVCWSQLAYRFAVSCHHLAHVEAAFSLNEIVWNWNTFFNLLIIYQLKSS